MWAAQRYNHAPALALERPGSVVVVKQADFIGSARAAGTARRAESMTVNGANPGPGHHRCHVSRGLHDLHRPRHPRRSARCRARMVPNNPKIRKSGK